MGQRCPKKSRQASGSRNRVQGLNYKHHLHTFNTASGKIQGPAQQMLRGQRLRGGAWEWHGGDGILVTQGPGEALMQVTGGFEAAANSFSLCQNVTPQNKKLLWGGRIRRRGLEI